MPSHLTKPCTAFSGTRRLLSGPLMEVALAVKAAASQGTAEPLLTFDDRTGRVIDLDLRGTKADVIERLAQGPDARIPDTPKPASYPAAAPPPADAAPGAPQGRGRPKIGVVGREVTLLPRHWEWLAEQPGGASVTLRKLVETARRTGGAARAARAAQERAYHFMLSMAGDLPGFEEATRALFAQDRPGFERHVTAWPADIASHAARLAFDEAAI